ncbi:MAG: pyridoxal phosphate-dependent aminotransferase [Polyangiaceae bacterium]
MSPFSKRSTHDTAENELTRRLRERRARGPVVDLTVSNPTTAGLSPPPLSEAGRLALSRPECAVYEPLPFGLPEAREAIASSLGGAISADDVVCTASTSEAYGWLFSLLADPGDAILVPSPSYPLFSFLAAHAAVRLVPYPLRYDGAWHTDLAELRRIAAAEPRARAVLVVSPNNPTGSVLTEAELEAMLDLGVPVISDEVFARYPLGARRGRFFSAREASRGLVLVLSGLSKEAALPQMKLGWIVLAGERALVDEAKARLEVLADTFLSVGAPVQHAARTLLEEAHGPRDAIVARTNRNLARLDEVLAGTAATRLFVEGGWYATVRLPAVMDEEAWVGALLERGVYVHPGAFFDFAESPLVVISLLTPEADLDEGLAILASTLAWALEEPPAITKK